MTSIRFADVIIVGGGPGGIAAAIWCERVALRWILLEKEDILGGQLAMIHTRIPDYPGGIYPSGAALRQQLETHLSMLQVENNIVLNQEVQSIDTTQEILSVETKAGQRFRSTTLIIASGVQRRQLRHHGISDFIHKGVSYTASGAIDNFRQRPTAIIGGGDGALENALKLAKICPIVHLIYRKKTLRARQHFIDQAQQQSNIFFHPQSTLTTIKGTDWIENISIQTPSGSQDLEVSALLIKIGFTPAVHIPGMNIEQQSTGHIVISPTQRTTDPRIWAIGDVCSDLDPSLSLAIGQASVAVRDIERFLYNRPKN